MKITLHVNSTFDSESPDHAVQRSFNEGALLNKMFDRIMAITELRSVLRLRGNISNLAHATALTAWVRENVITDDNTGSFTLKITTLSTVVSIKWFSQHSRHFNHLLPHCALVDNVVSQLNDFSWVSLQISCISNSHVLPASNIFVVIPSSETPPKEFPEVIPYKGYSFCRGLKTGERCMVNWLSDSVMDDVIVALADKDTRNILSAGGQIGNSFKLATVQLHPKYIRHVVHVEHGINKTLVHKHPEHLIGGL